MITDTDSVNTIDLGGCYVILPSVSYESSEEDYLAHHNAEKVSLGFRYNSGTNDTWESVQSLGLGIVEHIDRDFQVWTGR